MQVEAKKPDYINNPAGYRTALHDAAENGELDLVRVLLDAGADITALDPEGNTPLILAEKSGNDDMVQLIRSRAH